MSGLFSHEKRMLIESKASTWKSTTCALLADVIGFSKMRTMLLPPLVSAFAFLGSCCGFAAPAVSVTHMEIVQTIQDDKGSVPLIAGRPTFVRVFFAYTGAEPELRPVSSQLYLWDDKGRSRRIDSDQSVTIAFDKFYNDKLKEKRKELNGGMLFQIPWEFSEPGIIHIRVTNVAVWENKQTSKEIECTNCDAGEKSIEFFRGFPLRLVLVPIMYNSNWPTLDDIRQSSHG